MTNQQSRGERLPNLDEVEAQVRGRTIAQHRQDVASLERTLNVFLDGFRQMNGLTLSEEQVAERVWSYLVFRAFNSIRWGYHLILVGYYPQSLILVRSVYEDWLVCMDCRVRPETAAAILSKDGHMPSFKEMSDRLPEQLRLEWQEVPEQGGSYGMLSTIAHPRHRAVAWMRDPETGQRRMGAMYDENLFLFSAHYLCNALSRVLEFLTRLVVIENPDWIAKIASPAMKDLEGCVNRLVERAKDLLGDDQENARKQRGL